MNAYRNILVAGLTGSGKTTFSTAIAIALDIDRVSGSALRQSSILGAEPDRDRDRRRFWLFDESARRADFERMNRDTPDVVDALLLDLHGRSAATVFDVWFLPWLIPPGSLRIWLESPAEVRAGRVAGSSARLRSLSQVRAAVVAKDDRSRAYGLKYHAVDVFTDREPFEVIVDNDGSAELVAIERVVAALAAAALFGNTPLDVRLTRDDRAAAQAVLRRCPAALRTSLGIEDRNG